MVAAAGHGPVEVGTALSASEIAALQATAQGIPATRVEDRAIGVHAADPSVRRSYDLCAHVVRERARNFYHGLKLLPEPKRSAMYSIYAWMRAADDAVDEGGSHGDRRARLDEFAQATDTVLGGGSARAGAANRHDGTTFWPAFAQTARQYPIERRLFVEMLAGMADDLEARTYATDDELSEYCYRVASTVGLVCVRVWGLRPGVSQHDADELAIWRGQAFQRTNILRDFRQDFDDTPRRVYLPSSAFERAGVRPEEVRNWVDPTRCGPFIARQAEIARAYYTRSAPLDEMIQPDCRPTLWAMTRIYSGILELIERDPRSVVGERRLRLGGLAKCAIASRALLKARLGRW